MNKKYSLLLLLISSLMVSGCFKPVEINVPSFAKGSKSGRKTSSIESSSGQYSINLHAGRDGLKTSNGKLPADEFLHLYVYSGGASGSAAMMHWIEHSLSPTGSFLGQIRVIDYNEEIVYPLDRNHFFYGQWLDVRKVEGSSEILEEEIATINGHQVHFILSSTKYFVDEPTVFKHRAWQGKEATRVFLHAFIKKGDFSMQIFQPAGGVLPVYNIMLEEQTLDINKERPRAHINRFLQSFLQIN